MSVRSERLSAFHGRPIHLRAGVILPPGHDEDAARRYPLRVRIGGYGARYTGVRRMMRPGSPFRTAWIDPGAPRFVLLHLDGAGALGRPLPGQLGQQRPLGRRRDRRADPPRRGTVPGRRLPGCTRVLDGASTGGWVALALQIFYPDFFGGAWASCPDSVDFRAFQLVDVYRGGNAYVDGGGRERPSARNVDGSTRFTMRHELRMENVLGARRQLDPVGRSVGGVERGLRPARRGRPPRPPLGPRLRPDRHRGGRALGALRPAPRARAGVGHPGPEAAGPAEHLGRRHGRLLPRGRGAPPRRVPAGPASAPWTGADRRRGGGAGSGTAGRRCRGRAFHRRPHRLRSRAAATAGPASLQPR